MTVEEMARDPRVTVGTDHTTTPKGDRELSSGRLVDSRRLTKGTTK